MEFQGQKGQDRWLIEEALGPVRGGYFLDLAASDGVTINNTVYLERQLGWTGVCIEADPEAFAILERSRDCRCVQACVDGEAGEVDYIPTGELGGIVDDDTDNNPAIRPALLDEWRRDGRLLKLKTRTLADILDEAGAPPVIDYFSFDVEGAETRILRTFPFDRYRFLALTIERPTPELNALLFRHGYLFVRNQTFDSFYVHETAPCAGTIRREPFEQIPLKDW